MDNAKKKVKNNLPCEKQCHSCEESCYKDTSTQTELNDVQDSLDEDEMAFRDSTKIAEKQAMDEVVTNSLLQDSIADDLLEESA